MNKNDMINARATYNNTVGIEKPESKEGVVSWENNQKKIKKEYTKINEDGSPMKLFAPSDFLENAEVEVI